MPDQPPKTPQTQPPPKSIVPIQIQKTESSFSGPLPHPDILLKYGQINKDFPERIMKMAELENEHRRNQENKSNNADIEGFKAFQSEIRLGQIFAFIIGIFTIFCGAYTATHGSQWAGGFIGTGGVIGLVSVFIFGRNPPKS
ncbi:MAG TPA: DUF2335 domain-containing protein [Nitrospiria bacterium]|nr:DUF2335 domain-containing protein [Nitrospiria bacterium]